jgi:aryl-alcohol dehydrogenase-like predicted oxidoreductase
MRYRRLGKSGPLLSVVGMGCWAMGGKSAEWSWGSQDDDVSIRAVRKAVDLGVNWFDTAPTYGLGHSEQVLGRALKPIRHEVFVATKFGRVWDEAGHLGRCGRYDWIIQECEASLRRLGTDYIDLYQMHWPDTDTGAPVEESMRAAVELLSAGKVRYVGVSNFDVPLLERALRVCPLVSLQQLYNLLRRGAQANLIPFCRRHDLGVIAYSPLASGLLGGNPTTGTRISSDDWRARDPDFIGERLQSNLELVGRLRQVAEDEGLRIAQLAVSWVLRDEAVTSAVVGVRKPQHIVGIAPAADHELSPEATSRIAHVLASTESE